MSSGDSSNSDSAMVEEMDWMRWVRCNGDEGRGRGSGVWEVILKTQFAVEELGNREVHG